MWKLKWKLEAVKGYAFTLAVHIKRQKLECGTILRKIYDKKTSEYSIDHHYCTKTFLKACGSLRSVQPHSYQLNDEPYVANYLIFKTISVEKFPILALKFNHFLKNIFRNGFAHF